MGSFNATCIISNLPIEAGTPVRFFLLTRSKYGQGNDHICYAWGRWQLRGAALRAKYNDYGSIEAVPESLVTRAMFEALSRDAVEMGVGDNQCHDVQVRPGMSQKEWLEALWEGRVFVQDISAFKLDKNWKRPEPAVGIPSLTRLEELFLNEGLKVVTGFGAEGYFLDEVSLGFIRVRHGRMGEGLEHLELILPLLHKAGYAAMVTCGTGNYANHAEVLVAPKPTSGLHIHTSGLKEVTNDFTDSRPVSQVMVREDVWRILLQAKYENWSGDVLDIKRMKVDALLWLKKVKNTSPQERLEMVIDGPDRDNSFSCAISGGEGSSGYSLNSAFTFGIKIATDQKELEKYVLELAEIAFVQLVYGCTLHGQWHPTTNSGQDPHWKEHRAFFRKLLKIRGNYED